MISYISYKIFMKDLSNKNIVHIEHNGIQYLQFKKLLQYSNKITHCFTLKNLDLKGKDKNADDYKKICNELNLNQDNLIIPKQTHTNKVEVVRENSTSTEFVEIDGLVTNEKNKILSLKFADCTAFLLYDPVKNVIGDIHSGWKGTVKKIGEKAIEKMINEYGCNPKDIICCIAPTIRQCHFEVEDDVKDLFMESFNDETIIKKGDIKDGKQKYYIDTVTANINMFKKCGLLEENIIDSGICTVCNYDQIHSYRKEKENSGRNACIISLI